MTLQPTSAFSPYCSRFNYNSKLQDWVNTTCELDPTSDWDTAYYQTLFAIGTTEFYDFVNLVGRQLAIEAVDISGMPLNALHYIVDRKLGDDTSSIRRYINDYNA
ncbi:uncharacterized protein RJT20DRAFT_2984 [Scheffersomyces xylosifermentans]|uniref:uncharacterized protein n=1 Tax=Scheffersomyces xylosifermentans TaxID=1304137 RepID=UPI00315CB3C2